MGTYNIPRNLKGETRILVIFTTKALISTALGAAVGAVFWLIFSVILGLKIVGVIMIALFAAIGFVLGRFNIPVLGGIPFTKKIGGEPVSEIVLRYFKFKANRKIYTYTKEEK